MATDQSTIGALLDNTGGSIKTGPFGTKLKASEYTATGVPVISVGEVGFGRLRIHDDTPRVDESVSSRMPEFLLKAGDIVFGRKGAVERSAQLQPDEDGYFLGSDGIRIRLNIKACDPKFIAYQLLTSAHRNWMIQHAGGTTMPSLNEGIIRRIPIVLPPLVEQKAIAAVLGALDDKIELNHRMNATLEGIARALFQSWFVDFDPLRAKVDGRQPPGIDPATAALFPNEFRDSELGRIPIGWNIGTLGTLFGAKSDCVLTGPFGSNLHASDYSDEGVPLILVKHVMDGRIIEDRLPLVGANKVAELARYRLKLGDIVFTRVGAVGRTGYVHLRNVGWLISGQTLRVRIPDWHVLHPRYLAQVYLDRAFIAMVEGHSLGTTRPSLNTGLLRDFRFLVPPPTLTNRFAEIVTPFDEQRQHLDAQSRTLADLRDALLPKLLSGEIRTS